ncbi:phage integrase [Dyella caseinilytica]|nr:phage integrase [Dyella caseinilytica]
MTEQGYHADGGGLYLQVTASGAKSWIFRYTRGGKTRDMGLGPVHTIGLAEARTEATEARRALVAGTDPLDARRAAQAERARIPTFAEAAAEYIDQHKSTWTNPKHADQWANTLATYADPFIGTKAVDQVDTADMLAILKPIWESKTETATRVRQRVETVLDAQYAQRHWDKRNPARWRGHLDKLLPKPSRVRKVEHFAALPYADMPAFMAKLRDDSGIAARALEFLIMTASRTNMVTKAVRSEIADDTWTIPAERMKMKKEHRIPLIGAAVALVDALPRISGSDYLFHGDRHKFKSHLSNGAMDALLERMGCAHITVHGFRSTFKDWATEQTDFANEVSEAALAHAVADKTEAAYRRGELMDKRRKLMEAWGAYLAQSPQA